MRLATWNVNSIRIRHELLIDWLRSAAPDVLCLQETKVVDDDFPTEELQRLGYAVAMAGQKTYNGVAIATRLPLKDVSVGLVGDDARAEKRLIAATIGGVRVLSAYVPNGKSVSSPSFAEKLRWLARLRATLDATVTPGADVVVCGDFNIATDERDLWSPALYAGQLHFHPEEHRALAEVRAFGLVDAFRLHHAESGAYSWWDYRGGGFERDQGLRIDYIFLSAGLAPRCTDAFMDVAVRRRDKPSDHVPVVADLA